jgi:ABC-2 type transport system permease protein
VLWGAFRGADIPWWQLCYYTLLLMSLSWCFLGIAMLISTLTRTADVAQGAAFIVWIGLLLFLDLLLLGVMIRGALPPEAAVGIALANPLQVFRTAAMMLFDQQLVLLGPSAYVILDHFGQIGYMTYAVMYPILVGTACVALGYRQFARGDLL